MLMNQKIEDVDFLLEQAELAIADGDIQKLIGLYERIEQLGVGTVTARIGELYETGYEQGPHTFEKNYNEAIKWYHKAVLGNDDPVAHLGLGRIYYHGSSTVETDLLKAQTHLRKAYDNNLPQAGIYLGAMYMNGVGVEKSLTDAERYFATAAAGGFPQGYGYLASIAASSGRIFRAFNMLAKQLILTVKLKIEDRRHPNLG